MKTKYAKTETIRESTYLSDSLIVGERCEAVLTARTRCGLAKLRECGEFPLRLRGMAYRSYVWPGILNGSEV